MWITVPLPGSSFACIGVANEKVKTLPIGVGGGEIPHQHPPPNARTRGRMEVPSMVVLDEAVIKLE